MVMTDDTDPDVFLSEVHQLHDEPSDLGEVVSTARLTSIILDALPVEKYLSIKVQAIGDSDKSIGEVESMIKTIFSSHSESCQFQKGVKSCTVKVIKSIVYRRSLVVRGPSVILTLQSKFLNRVRSYVDL